MLCVWSCETCAQSQAEIVERLNDGSFIVRIDGVEFRAISAEKTRQLAKDKAELESLKQQQLALAEQVKAMQAMIKLLEKQQADSIRHIGDLNALLTDSQAQTNRALGLLEEYRQQAKLNWLTKALNSTPMKIAGLALPVIAAAIAK